MARVHQALPGNLTKHERKKWQRISFGSLACCHSQFSRFSLKANAPRHRLTYRNLAIDFLEATETGMAALLLAITIVLAMHIHLRALGSSLVLGEVEPVKQRETAT